jgi:hypothetical protein
MLYELRRRGIKMSLQIYVRCSNHQKADGGYGREEEIWIDTLDLTTAAKVQRHLERNGWVVQLNGKHMDTYCSKKCAE